MTNVVRWLVIFGLILVSSVASNTQTDSYSVLLHSRSITAQREALKEILTHPEKYAVRIQKDLLNYPRLLHTDRVAAHRAVYLSALVRDPSFPTILVKSLNDPAVLDECEYACPAVFALAIDASFAGWRLPPNLDSQLSTVHDLKSEIDGMSRVSLRVGSIEDVVQGPALDRHRKDIEGKTEYQLIQLAGLATAADETRMFAVFRLETLVSDSKHRIDLYLLALNDFEDDSGEYRGAVYRAIYRAETAKHQGK